MPDWDMFYIGREGTSGVSILSTDTNEVEYFKNWLENDVQFRKGLSDFEKESIDKKAKIESGGHGCIVAGWLVTFDDEEFVYLKYQVIRELASRGWEPLSDTTYFVRYNEK